MRRHGRRRRRPRNGVRARPFQGLRRGTGHLVCEPEGGVLRPGNRLMEFLLSGIIPE